MFATQYLFYSSTPVISYCNKRGVSNMRQRTSLLRLQIHYLQKSAKKIPDMGSIFQKAFIIFRLHIHYIQKLAKKYQVCYKMGVPNFGEVYIIFMSSHTPYLEVVEKIPESPQNEGAYITFMSSHTLRERTSFLPPLF